MSQEFTVKEMAAREQVHERTVRRWIRDGRVSIRRTPGVGIRIMPQGSAGGQTVVMMPSPRDTASE